MIIVDGYSLNFFIIFVSILKIFVSNYLILLNNVINFGLVKFLIF